MGGWCLNGLGCLVTWYISYAGGSWNLSGECSFDLFTACKQAYLVVLTVNVIVVFLIFMMFWNFFFFLAAYVLCVKAAQTSDWPGLIQSWCKHLLTVFFFYQNVYCQWWMYLFLVLPSPLQRICSVCETEVEAGPPLFFVLFFLLRISSWESKMRHKT